MSKINLWKNILNICMAVFILVVLALANNVFADVSLLQWPNNAWSITYNDSNWSNIIRSNPMNAQTANDLGATAILKYTNQTSKYLRLDNFWFTVPSNATIVGISVNVTRKISYDDSSQTCTISVNDSRVKLIKNWIVNDDYNPANSTLWTTWYTTIPYWSPTTLWWATWTPEDINNSNFGVVLAAKSNANCTGTVDVDTINVTVHYTIPETTMPPTCLLTYTPASWPVNTDVIALCNPSELVTFQNPEGTGVYIFTENGSFVFEFTDSDGNTWSATAIVTWIDKVGPVLNLPGTLTIEAISSTWANVFFDTTANDLVDGPTLVSCTPSSWSFFPLGTSIVSCSSSDSAGNTTTGSFNIVVVITPPVWGGGG